MSNSFNIDNLNSFLQQASQVVTCGSDCQKQQTAEQLKNAYLNAETNLASATNQVDVAQKNYVLFTEGTNAYDDLNVSQLTEKAELIANKFQDNFNEEYSKIVSQINTYSSLYVNLQNVEDLYNRYSKQKIKLFKELKNNTSDVLTNDRKTYYEEQGIEKLNFWYFYVLLTIYIICVLFFIFTAFFYSSNLNWKFRLSILICLFALPYVSSFILNLFLSFITFIYEFMPKKVY
jgi:hypothetical protein